MRLPVKPRSADPAPSSNYLSVILVRLILILLPSFPHPPSSSFLPAPHPAPLSVQCCSSRPPSLYLPCQVVKALKAMQRSLVYGDQVTQLLNASPVWKDYEKQKHDLFLDNEKPLALTQVDHNVIIQMAGGRLQ